MHWGWAYDGVNASIPRNTGAECVNYLSTVRHVGESATIIPLSLIIFNYGVSKLPALNVNYDGTNRIWFGKQLLLIIMTSLLGLEMGFKLCTRTAIYILNPCHVTSILQVYLLASKPTKWTTTLFRIHINYLNGPLLAFLFPEHDSRKITFELPTYYIQHGLMFVIPAYLLRQGGNAFFFFSKNSRTLDQDASEHLHIYRIIYRQTPCNLNIKRKFKSCFGIWYRSICS